MPHELIPLMSIIMGSLTVTGSVWALAWYKVKQNEFRAKSGDAQLGPAVDALRDDIDQVVEAQEQSSAQLAEIQERLDFAERLLTAGRASIDDKE